MKNNQQHTERGQVLLFVVFFFLVIAVGFVVTVNSLMLQEIRMVNQHFSSVQSLATAESLGEDMVYRLKNGMNISTEETLDLNLSYATGTQTAIPDGTEIILEGDALNAIRKARIELSEGSGVAFNYGVQAGEGGFLLENTSSIQGNAFSNGPVEGSGNYIYGTVISAGPNGLIDNIHATSSAYANTIQNSTVDKDAYYQTISNTTVGGTKYPDSDDQSTSSLPISDSKVEEWKQQALDGGVISSPCPYQITDDETIGPVKIACDLEISKNNFTVTLAGPIWVEGDITIQNGPKIQVASSLGEKSVVVVADNESDRESSGTIKLENKAAFEGSGEDGSYILLLSQNNSAENNGGTDAISVENSAHGDLLIYAGHGEVQLQNSVNLKEVTGYRIHLQNSAEVVYESGLTNTLFDSGPGGGYEVRSWEEIK